MDESWCQFLELMNGADGEIIGWALEAYVDSFLKWNGRASDHVQSLLTILSKTFSSTGAFVQLLMYGFKVYDVFTWTVIVHWCTPTRSYTNLTDLCSECNYFNENTELIWMQEFHSHVLEVSLELSTYLQEQGLGFMCAHSLRLLFRWCYLFL